METQQAILLLKQNAKLEQELAEHKRELEIEASLERVRSKTMAMHKSEDLAEAAKLLFQQVQALGLPVLSCGYNIWQSGETVCTGWMSDSSGSISPPFRIPLTESPTFMRFRESRKMGEYFYTEEVSGEALAAHYSYMLSIPNFKSIVDGFQNAGFALPAYQVNNVVNFSHGNMIFITNQPAPEAWDIFKRFGKVFEQTYTRFLDLQKAEAQAREAQIELGLERVRSRAMAMQGSAELSNLIETVYAELTRLDVSLDRCFIMIFDSETLGATWWMADALGAFTQKGLYLQYHEHPPHLAYLKAWQERREKWQYILEGKVKKDWDEYIFSETELCQLPALVIANMKAFDRAYISASFNNFGCLTTGGLQPITEESFDILLRFSKVFDSTYTRFNDLKKAEAQARKAEVELGLERVRARAMAMQKSEELAEAAKLLYHELRTLNISPVSCGYMFINEEEQTQKAWVTLPDGTLLPDYIVFPLTGEPILDDRYKGWKQRVPLHKAMLEGEANKAHHRFLSSQVPANFSTDIFDHIPENIVFYSANFSAGYLMIIATELFSAEEEQTIIRFAKVFEITYTRFLDLQKAEAQAIEAQIQLAMERVRARTMAMQHSDELADAAVLLFQQVKSFGLQSWGCGFNIWEKDDNVFTGWMSSPEGKLVPPSKISLNEHPLFMGFKESKQNGVDFYVLQRGGKELEKFYQYLLGIPVLGEEINGFLKSGGQLPSFQIDHVVNFSHGNLIFITYEPVPEAHDIFKRFGRVFEQTYTRFLDLQKAEAQAREAVIETVLEKIRSRSLAMHRSDELKDVIAIIFEKLDELKILLGTVAIWLFDKATKDSIFWVGNNLQQPTLVNLPYDEELMKENTNYKDSWQAFLSGESYINKEYSEEEKNRYFRYVFSQNDSTAIPPEARDFLTQAKKYIACLLVEKNSSLYFDCWNGQLYGEEQINVLKRVAKVFEQAYIRFLDLQKAEAQAREAQIEVALERVRSRTMAMHKGEELADTAMLLFDQLSALGIKQRSCGFLIMNKQSETMADWSANLDAGGKATIVTGTLTFNQHPILAGVVQTWEKGDPYFIGEVHGDELQKYYGDVTSKESASDEIKQKVLALASSEYTNSFNFQFGMMYVLTPEPLNEHHINIMLRFAAVFKLTYTRFLDLQKAEAQTREAQIELSLERVRAKTMAMHNSADVGETAAVMVEELKKLGIETLRCGIGIMHEPGDMEVWTISTNENNKTDIIIGWLDMNMHPLLHGAFESWRNKVDSYSYELKDDDLLSYYNAINNYPGYPIQYDTANLPKQIHHNEFHFSEGTLFAFSLQQLTDEQRKIFKRFAGVFGQTYRRYLDLKKAEAQAREARIEAALERVRSEAMAMHSSEGLLSVTLVLRGQMAILEQKELESILIHIYNEKNNTFEAWFSYRYPEDPDGKIINGKCVLDWTKTKRASQDKEKYYLKESDYTIVADYTMLKEWYEYLEIQVPEVVEHNEHGDILIPDVLYYNYSKFSGGTLLLITNKEASVDSKYLLKRSAEVFNLAYTRFLDLQKTEAQAREAKIEAALERVRSRTLAMQKSDELAETSAVLFKQLIGLGIEPHRLYFTIIKDNSGQAEFWITDEDGTKVSSAYTANLNDNKTFKKMFSGWEEKKKSLVIDMQGQELQDYFSHLTSLKIPFKDGISHKRRIQHLAYFNKGFIGMASADEQPEETSHLLERFAAVFNLTFTRFNDLKIAEAHAIKAEEDLIKLQTEKKRAEDALNELQVTQKQLIQSEKMASLGELTAGIAHEIQNPLNFVNNFSEVSKELLDEMKAALANGDADAVEQIADDIIKNLEKINHHGKRADAIVKGMLQHSQASKGQKQFTDINALADEYLRLSYHGLRAKHKDFNATIKTNFDGALGKINIVPQDIGRVLLNLYNNAFYAVNDASAGSALNYQPTVSVSTKKINDKVEIKVSDNGSGIPQNIVDKIFQPFFTTKPTGQGTGLGLSLSYDIIKVHGGEIHVETKEGEGTQFIIKLPIMPI